jgi:hypothetical protein
MRQSHYPTQPIPWLATLAVISLINPLKGEEEPKVNLIPQGAMGHRGHVHVNELEWRCDSPWLGKKVMVSKVAKNKPSSVKLIGLAESMGMKRRPQESISNKNILIYEGKNVGEFLTIHSITGETSFGIKTDKIFRDDNKDPIVQGMPETPALLGSCVSWLDKMGIDRNGFMEDPKSVCGYRFTWSDSTLEYLNNKQQKRLTCVAKRNINFTQKIGEFPAFWNGIGGRVLFAFRDGGEMSEIQFCLRPHEPLGECQVLTKEEVTQAILEGFCWVTEPLDCDKGIILRSELSAFHAGSRDEQTHFTLVWLVDIEPVGKPDDAVCMAIPALKQHRNRYGKVPTIHEKPSLPPGIVPMEDN